jgi:hypothetical protein
MAYDRYDTRDDQPRWRNRDDDPRSSGRGDNRGFFERAGDELASWFGDDRDRDRDHGRMSRDGRDPRYDQQRGAGYDSGSDRGRDYDRGYGRDAGRDRDTWLRHDRDRSDHRDDARPTAWPSSERDYNPSWRQELRDRPDDRQRGGYRPMTGDYGRSEQLSGAGGFGSADWRGDRDRGDRDSRSEWDRDPYRSSSRAGTRDKSDRSRDFDPHYNSWRDQHMSELDRDYDDYRREHQSKFDDDFSSWRERRSHKRGLLSQIREHMEVVGNDDQHVGTVDKVAGDRIILTKSDPESGGVHHSLSCSEIDRVEDDKVILDCSADKARERWRDESRSRALFEREDQGEMGNHVLNRSFEGTYR